MVIVWGTGLYGRVDEVPGVCWVATQFFHLYYIPLVPMGSQAVLEQNGNEWRGAAISLSFKSVLIAYLRAALIVAGIVGIVVTIMAFTAKGSRGPSILAGVLPLVVGFGGFWASKVLGPINVASYERARSLLGSLGVPEELHVLNDVNYGKLSPQEAEGRLEKLGAQREVEEEQAEQRKQERRDALEAKRAARLEAKKETGTRKRRSSEEDGERPKAPKARKRTFD
ncbi:MAG: hypothetical protein AB7N76_11195 [Planctomycetota bacterium]